MPLYWLKVPRPVMEHLARLGFHRGYWREDEIDVTLRKAFETDTSLENKRKNLTDWTSYVDREACLLDPGHPTLWHPDLSESDCVLIREHFGTRLIEIEAKSVDETLHKFRLCRWNLGVFYHVACMGNWKEVIAEQLTLLHEAGLRFVYVSILGTDDDRVYFEQLAGEFEIVISVQYHHDSIHVFELPTIKLLEDWAHAHPDNYLIYFHTKGVSDPSDLIKVKWRHLMQSWVITKWRENAELLREGREIVGVNWRSHPPSSHFPGNFWMARASYINTLEDFGHYFRHPRHSAPNHINQWRLGAEFWIGSGQREPLFHSHVSYNERIDLAPYWSSPGD